MARPIVLSNGELHVGLDRHGMVNDFYYPYVGSDNHAAEHYLRHRIGVWVDGQFSWVDDGSWTYRSDYPHHSLIGRTELINEALGVMLEFDDFVDAHQSAFLRNIHVINNHDNERTIKLFMHQIFVISRSQASDTAQFFPDADAIMHYKGNRVFIISGQHSSGQRFDEYSVGLFGIEGHDGTYKDAEDGSLSFNAVEHGKVDSVIGYSLNLKPHDSTRVIYWVAAGKSTHEALTIHRRISNDGILHRMLLTDAWWRDWMKPSEATIQSLPEQYRDIFRKSLLILKSHIDKRGAVIASTDTDMLNYARDAYAYCWPRDAAFVIWPLIRMGYKDEPLQFFNFCRRALHPDGYLMQKYLPDGSIGSSWHSYIHDDGVVAPPIQEDETAIVLFMLLQYFHYHDDERTLRDYYRSLIQPMANFLAGYIDETTKLPKPSYDLWEQVFLTSTYTTALTHAGLQAAIHLAEKIGENEDAIRWGSIAGEMHTAAKAMLYNKEKQYFYHGVTMQNGELKKLDRIDSSSFYGAFMFGLFSINSQEVQQSRATLTRLLQTEPHAPGLPRYEHDDYYAADPAGKGNPWVITTLWMAQYAFETGSSRDALTYLDWVVSVCLPSGVISEQINPYSKEFISVAPLAWSHAELISTMLDLVIKPPEIET